MDHSQTGMDDFLTRTDSDSTPAEAVSTDPSLQPEQAAGGLVWRSTPAGPTLAVVHRPYYNDWTLPKGRPAPGEPLPAAARREAQEETGVRVSMGPLAGAYTYEIGDRLKVVLMWHMDATQVPWGDHVPEEGGDAPPAPWEDPAPQDEVDEVVWLPAVEAVGRLTHAAEQKFVTDHALGRIPEPEPAGKRSIVVDPEIDRISAAIASVRVSLAGLVAESGGGGGWWTPLARESLAGAVAALHRGKLDVAWGALHDCERFMIPGMTYPHLQTRAVALRAEADEKLTGWRRAAALRLLPPEGSSVDWHPGGLQNDRPPEAPVSSKQPGSSSPERSNLQQGVLEVLALLHGRHDNVYHRMRVVRRQLVLLVQVTAGLLTGAFLLSVGAARGTDLGPGPLAAVALAGALGAVLSGLYHLSKGGRPRIPEAQLDSIVSVGRPAIGAVAALFLYAVLKSGFINLIDPASVSLFHGVALGFVAGFSERFVLSTAGRVSGQEEGGRQEE